MRSITAFSGVLLASFPLGGVAGLSWQLGNGLAEGAAVSLFVSLGVAVSVAGALGEGTGSDVGAHTFSWGLSYACGQSFHDIHHGTWPGDD